MDSAFVLQASSDADYRPTATRTGLWRLVPILRDYIPSRRIQRFLVGLIPSKAVQQLKDIIWTIDARSHEIYNEKISALRAGGEAVKQQVGEGKDIMSVLRAYLLFWSVARL